VKLINEETGLRISIEQSLVDRLMLYGRNHYPKEFGGVLVGYYSEDKRDVNIIDSILPIDFTSSKTTFERGVEGLTEALEKYYNHNPSLVYIGEWHTHPNVDPVPSCTDYNAMREIVAASSVCIDNPVMIIIGLTENSAKLTFYVYMENKFYKYEII
jgi:integrative and conjugative element protein (TIGR02256 family)